MIYDVEHLLLCLFSIFIFFLVRCLLRSFINLIVFLLLNFKSYLYVLGVNYLSGMCFVKMFCRSVACLFILLTVTLRAKVFNFNEKFLILMKSQFS